MRIILWAVGAVLLGVAALGVYWAFQSPTFVAGLSALATAAAWQAIKPAITKPLSKEELAARQKAYRRGDDGWLKRRLGSLKD